MGGGADTVEDDAGDAQPRVEGRVAMDHRGHGAGHRPRVDDEQDRRVEELGDVGCRGQLPAAALAVEEAHHPLDYRNVGPARAVGEERSYEVGAGEKGVEVAAWPAGGQSVVGGVYKVRADLEGGDAVASRRERGHQARGDGGLAGPGVGARNYHARDTLAGWRGPYHSMPFCPR